MQVTDDAALARHGLIPSDFIDAVSAALVAHARGEMLVQPKRALATASGIYASGTHAIWPERDQIFFHNLVGLDKERDAGGASTYRSAQLLFRASDAMPLRAIHGSMISSQLPVVMTCLAGRLLAPTHVESVAFIGAGMQAKLHLEALARVYPLKRVAAFSRSERSGRALVEQAAQLGVEAVIAQRPIDAVRGASIVVSSISESLGIDPFLELDWLERGAFLSSVDMLRPWRGGDAARAVAVTDDIRQAREMIDAGRMPDLLPLDVELGQLLACVAPPPFASDRTRVLLQPGCCASLFGMAAAVLARLAPHN